MTDRLHEPQWLRYMVIGIFATIALAPLSMHGCGPEWARWDAAQARHYFRAGETEDALYQLRTAARKSPRDPMVKLTLATSLIEDNQPKEGLRLANEVLEVYPTNGAAMQVKANSQQRMGNFEGGLETYLKYDSTLNVFVRRAESLNNIAYFRGLAKKDLHLAKRDIEDTIANTAACPWDGGQGIDLPYRATVVASLVGRCCDLQETILPVLSQLIDELADATSQRRKSLSKSVYDQAQDDFRGFKRNANDINLQRLKLRKLEKSLAALLTCRALLHQDLGNLRQCQSDREWVVRFGLDADEIAADFPPEKATVLELLTASTYLDTRGFVMSRLPWVKESELESMPRSQQNFNGSYESAIRDLNVAILCSRVWLKSFESREYNLHNSVEFFEDKPTVIKNAKRTIAVLLNHRMELHLRRGDSDLAEIDEKEICEYGFEPGPELF
jgi:tetratricopeptide (TPR) repeat protein